MTQIARRTMEVSILSYPQIRRACRRRELCALAIEGNGLTRWCAVISDPENPKFDLEAYLNDVHARNG